MIKYFEYDVREVELERLRVGLLQKNGSLTYVKINETPHYEFVMAYIESRVERGAGGYASYNDYNLRAKHTTTDDIFKLLIESIHKNGFVTEYGLIQATRSVRRLAPWSRYDVTDGAHRVSILSAFKVKKIQVSLVMQRESYLKSFLNQIRAF